MSSLPTRNPSAALVLVVDDNDALRAIIQRVLTAAQVTTVTCKGAVEALDVLAIRPVKIVLTDLSMPDMDGWQSCSLAHTKYPALILGIMTGSDASDSARLAAHGISFVVPKPFNVRELQAQILALLRPPALPPG